MNDAPVGHSSMRGAVAGDGGLRLRREVKGREDDEGREEEAGFHVVSEQEDEEAADGGRVPIDYRRPRRSSRPTRSALALARRRIRVAAAGGRRRRRRRIPKPLAEVRPSGVPPRRPRTAGGRLLPRRALGRVFLRGGGEGTQVDRLPLLGEAFTSVLSGGEASRRDDGVPPPATTTNNDGGRRHHPANNETRRGGGGGAPRADEFEVKRTRGSAIPPRRERLRLLPLRLFPPPHRRRWSRTRDTFEIKATTTTTTTTNATACNR